MPTPSDLEYREIPLTKGQIALVDVSDFEFINQWKWYARWSRKTQSFYASRKVWLGRNVRPRTKEVQMHRVILGLAEGDRLVCDHREPSQTLDNRRFNLRVATGTQNNANARVRKDNTSGCRGVSWNAQRGKWRVSVFQNGRRYDGGHYSDFILACEARKAKAKEIYGDFARV